MGLSDQPDGGKVSRTVPAQSRAGACCSADGRKLLKRQGKSILREVTEDKAIKIMTSLKNSTSKRINFIGALAINSSL